VAAVVEEQLREFARNEGIRLVWDEDENGSVEVCFGAVTVRGENLDIAILRLANALLEDHRYSSRLTRELGRASGLSLDQNSHGKDGARSASALAVD
jgi:hypothetical protein